MNTVQIFKHPELGEIRGIEINGEPWFVGKDVAAALGYSNTRKAIIDHVDEEDKSVTKRDALGGLQGMIIINENGLYSLIFSCKLPNAKKIKNWIQRDILPILREHNKPTKNDDNTSESLVNTPDMDKKCAIQAFENPEFGQIRMLEEDGKVLFCGSDIAKALGYARPNDAVSDHCRYTVKRRIPHPQTLDKLIEMLFIPEGDVYRLIVRSDLPSAEKFERWVFDEVLPSIRKHGMYIPNPAASRYDISELSPSLQMANALSKTLNTLLGNIDALFDSMAQTEMEQKRQAEEQARQAAEQERQAQEQARQAEEQERMAQEQEQHTEALKTVDQKLEDIRDVVVVRPKTWRKDYRRLVSAIAQKRGGANAYRDTNTEIFKLVDDRAHVSLKRRLKNRRDRMAEQGISKSKQDKVNQMDIIAADDKLIEIYIAIVKEMCIQYEISPSVLEEAQGA